MFIVAPCILGTANIFRLSISLPISTLYSKIFSLNSGSNITFSIAKFSRFAFAKSGLSVLVALII